MTNITPRAHGCDISKYDLYFKPELVTGQLDFVVQRISYGVTRDEAFISLLPGVMQVPIRGGYHYLSSQLDWQKQADTFLSYVAGYDYHFYNCDFEGAYNMLSYDFANNAYKWIDYVQQKSGKPVLLYTSFGLYTQWIYPSQMRFGIDWNKVKLWVAQWLFTPNPNGTPSNPAGRTASWSLWQYTNLGNGAQYGCSNRGEFDLDVYNGTPQQMAQWLGVTTVPPIGETTLNKYELLMDLNMRNAAISGSVVATLPKGSFVWGTFDVTSNWIHTSQYQKVGGAITPLEAWCSGFGTYVKQVVDTPVPTPTGKAVTVNVTIDGYNPLTLSGTLTPK